MCRKTIVKRHCKYLPKTERWDQVAKAIDLDNLANGFDEPISWEFVQYLEGELNGVGDDRIKERLRGELLELKTTREGKKFLAELRKMVPEVDEYGPVGSQTDAARQAAKLEDKDRS